MKLTLVLSLASAAMLGQITLAQETAYTEDDDSGSAPAPTRSASGSDVGNSNTSSCDDGCDNDDSGPGSDYGGDEGGCAPSTIIKWHTTTVYKTDYKTLYKTVTKTDYSTVYKEKLVYITVPGDEVTVTVPGDDVTATIPGDDITVTVPGGTRTVTEIETETVTARGGTDTVTVTAPGDIETTTITRSVTVDGPTTTVTDCPSPPPDSPSELVVCPSRIVDPTFTPAEPLPTDYHWGCPPGKLCTPRQVNCNFEANPPAESYFCRPEECKPSPEIPEYTSDSAVFPNPTDRDCAWYRPAPGFFNLDHEYFGLTYDIFNIYGQPVCEDENPDWKDWTDSNKPPKMVRSMRRGTNNPLALLRARQAATTAPAECYAVYNKASYFGQEIGFVTEDLCSPESDFQVALEDCELFVEDFPTSTEVRRFDALIPYLNYCETHDG